MNAKPYIIGVGIWKKEALMEKIKKLLTILLTAALLLTSVSGFRLQVQADTSALAASYNTNVNYIAYATDVEDQSQTNYCWAYMADAVLESYLMKITASQPMDLNEWDMISQLSSGSYAFSDLYTGGSYRQALAYWTRGSLYGPRLEANSNLTDYYVSETAELGRYQRESQQSKQNYIQNIKNLVVTYGAAGVSVYFTAQDRTLTTKDGAYYYPQESSPGVNHGVTVVGWDDNFAPQWFYNSMTTPQQPQNKGAFLVKNSWGKYDPSSIGGNTGYYWISYDNYFQDAFAVTQVLERSKLYDRIYETDYRGLYDYGAGDTYSRTYDLTGGVQWLTGFSTYVRAGASYRFYLNNQELTQCGGTMAQSGYHTFQLSSPVQVYGRLELRAEVTGNYEAVPLACSTNSHEPDGGNVCLKVFTKSQPGSSSTSPSWNPASSPSTVAGVTLTPQDCTVMPGSSCVFTAKVLGTPGNQPSQRISWQISGNSSPNTRITDAGILYVGADETSEVLYIYANSYIDSTQGASARVAIPQSGTANNPAGSGSAGTNTGANSSGAPTGTNTGANNTGSSTGTGNTGTNNTGTSTATGNPGSTNINGSGMENPEEFNGAVRVGTVDKGIYAIWEDGSAHFTQCTSQNRISITIPATVKIGGHTYDVTVLEDGSIRNQKKVQAVTVGKNIAQIGDEAFYGCKRLKKIKITSEHLEYIGEDAFYGISAKAVVYVPRSCLAEYRAMVRESGNGTVRVKAYN